jgi:non-canonical purine NTP pyrophosphatase (RdgB/HAM1 family)
MDEKINKINFATSSEVKINQYKIIFADYDIEIVQAPIITNLIEPQIEQDSPEGLNLLVAHPLRLAARFVTRHKLYPYMIEDTSLVIDDLSNPNNTKFGLPGADTKSWWNNLGLEGILRILRDTTNRTASFTAILGVYLGGNEYIFSRGTIEGTIAKEVRVSEESLSQVPYTNPFHFHGLFIPSGSKRTIGELNKDEFFKYDYRRKAAKKLAQKIKEYRQRIESQLKFKFPK